MKTEDIYVLPLKSCALNMRTSILYEFDGFLSSPKRARNKRDKISINWQKPSAAPSSFADPEGSGGQGVRTSLENYKNIGFLSNTGPDPLKNHSYQSSVQYWAII